MNERVGCARSDMDEWVACGRDTAGFRRPRWVFRSLYSLVYGRRRRAPMPPPGGGEGPGTTGVREPRRPLPGTGAGAVELPVPGTS